jgi:hypothetical protein
VALHPRNVQRGEVQQSRSSDENTAVYQSSGAEGLLKLFSNMHAARKGQPRKLTLFSMMLTRRGFGATNLQDLCTDTLPCSASIEEKFTPCPVVDYRRSVVEVFTDAPFSCLGKPKITKVSYMSMFVTQAVD